MFPTLLGAAGGEGRRREEGRGGVGPAKSLCQFWRLAQDDETGGHAWLATSDEVDQVQDEVDAEWRLASGDCGAARQFPSSRPQYFYKFTSCTRARLLLRASAGKRRRICQQKNKPRARADSSCSRISAERPENRQRHRRHLVRPCVRRPPPPPPPHQHLRCQ